MKGFRRLLLVLLAVCVLGSVAALGISGYVVSSQVDRIRDWNRPPGKVDAILVLGCGVDANGRPKPMLKDRLSVGGNLRQAGWSDRLLLSGDNSGPGYNEVGAMKDWLEMAGLPQDALILDNEGFNTDASIRRARDVFGMKRIVIVTQRYHLYRALYLAEAYGLEAYGVSATLRTYGPKQILWSAREILARDKDFLRMTLSDLY